jgi:bifunctional non-homologous end joining protein LigD
MPYRADAAHALTSLGTDQARRTASAERTHGVSKRNIMRILQDAVVPTRDELTKYWQAVGNRALRYLARRPLTLVRHLNGITFFHKGPLPPIPEPVHHLTFQKREGGEGVRVWIDNVPGLLGLVEMDVIELHPWGSTVDDIEHPDLLVFDLDPGPGIDWHFVIHTALELRTALQKEGYQPWAKTSGGKGLHVMVPLPDRKWDWAKVRVWTKRFAEKFANRDPRYTASSTVHREGRLFIDYLRNGRGNTAVGAYSPRARPGFPVSMPVSWSQVKSGIRSDTYTLYALMDRERRR